MNLPQLSDKRGSALLAVLIYCIILSAAAASFLMLVNQERKMVALSEANYCLMNLAESGLEEAVWTLYNQEWTDWKQLDNGEPFNYDSYKPPIEIEMSNGYKGYVRILIQNTRSEPVVFAEASTRIPGGKELKKQVRITFEIGGGSAGGLIAKGNMDLSGNPKFDSYDSRMGPPDYDHNRSDKITVGTVSPTLDALKLSSDVDIFGFAGTGLMDPVISGLGNKIRGWDTPLGDNIDPDRVARDFTFDFPDVTEPSWAGAITSLPPASGGVITLGDPVTPTKYKLDKLEVGGLDQVKIVGDVQIYLKDGMYVGGGASITISPDAEAEIYSPKDFTISGQGFVNQSSKPENLKIFGTQKKAGDQTLSLSGQSSIEAVFYMPNANANISGQAGVSGSLIADSVIFSGEGSFHYDLALDGASDPQIEGIASWHELSNIHQLDMDQYITAPEYIITEPF